MATKAIEAALRQLARPQVAEGMARYFKAGPAQYGEGDRFWGVKVPGQRAVVRRFRREATLADVDRLLGSPVHECRLTGLLLLVERYRAAKGDEATKAAAIRLYERRFDRVNNWDLVDSSAPHLTGDWYLDRDRAPLLRWARSRHLWTQRIAVMTTLGFIRRGDFSTTLELAELLLDHPHDLLHKAVGWMLREVGHRDLAAEEAFLLGDRDGAPRYRAMPRTMLRYAIEKLPKARYRAYLEGRA